VLPELPVLPVLPVLPELPEQALLERVLPERVPVPQRVLLVSRP
jgi:hypothetical protein